MSEVEELFADARRALADLPTENLGQWTTPRRILGVPRAPRVAPAGTAWHLGVLLVTDDAVLGTGDIIRAREEVRRGFAAESQRERAAIAAAAFRGGFPEGVAVHIGWTVLDPSALDRGAASGPLAVCDGRPAVRWSASGGYQPLEGYLRERIALLRTPPERA
ncbi:glutaminase [Microbacterium sp. cx-55]|uniref:glutaminase n=1 Tax=Microbacterium sp. cx-55 TaxID=2875948 RepID=UPI001CBBE4C5|nr:glutaminase [Microbacterium sp. cx-55]MBZ4487567.1 glutaminase [Microbacterium sp. cx-55]UGB35587.1 glutaminase [Microbacterium sp. cx-55]